MYLFISHSSADASVANEMCTYIENNGAECFIAPRDIHPGKEYAEEIIHGIKRADAMILIMSENANKSPHVLREVERAVSRSIPILVYKLEDVELSKSMEYFLMTHQWITSEKKRDYSEILAFIEKYENKEGNKSDNAEAVANNVEENPKRKLLIPSIIALLVLIVILIIVFFSNKGFNYQISYQTGDTITLGRYNDMPIEWRILKLSEDGTEAVLISSDILTMKAYDAAEGGTFNNDGIQDYWSQSTAADTDLHLQVQVRGNNDWSSSNIRTWLNSSSEVVTYQDQPPLANAMSEKYNAYHTEPGFLYHFTEDELESLIQQEITTTGNALSDEKTVITNDYVFLLSKEELMWFQEADISIYAEPTSVALAQDESNWYDIQLDEYNISNYYWWLREPVEGTSSQCYLVDNGYTQNQCTTANVGTEGFGIRPAIVVDLTKLPD